MELKLANGAVVLYDEADEYLVSQYKWRCIGTPRHRYASAHVGRGRGNTECIYMHRLFMGDVGDCDIDHINNNGLDNRRCNLRAVTHADNLFNSGKPRGRKGTSKYKGVCWYKPYGKWFVRLMYRKQSHFLGYFDDEVEAAKAHDAALDRFGITTGRKNFPDARQAEA